MSPPSRTAQLALRRKGIAHVTRALPSGLHPPLLRFAGFRGYTVPALVFDGRRIQGSLAITAALDEAVPDPPLLPADSSTRERVLEAERWGEQELQAAARRIGRWTAEHSFAVRRFLASTTPLPGATVSARLGRPLAAAFARKSGSSDEQVRRDLEDLPRMLDRVDALLADGVLGTVPDALTRAGMQILPSVAALAAMEDLRELVAGRPCHAAAVRAVPDAPGPWPAALPPGWVPQAGGADPGSG